jgi:hypothetical protein
MDTPLYTLPAVGWRVFRSYLIEDRGSVITSYNQWRYWSSLGQTLEKMQYVGDEALCSEGKTHPVPDKLHSCGFYAFHTLEQLLAPPRPWAGRIPLDEVINYRPARFELVNGWWTTGRQWEVEPTAPLLALVQGYGTVIAHDTTYRAQKMRIAALCSDGIHTRELVEAHAEALGIPALSLPEMEEYAEYAGVCFA